MSTNLLKEEKLTIIKALVEKVQKEFGCKVKFVESYLKGQTVEFQGKKAIIESVNSPSSYNIIVEDKLNEGVNFEALKQINEGVDIKSSYKEISALIKEMNIRMIAVKGKEIIELRGEIDFQQFEALTIKMMGLGYIKTQPIKGFNVYENKQRNAKVVIPKPTN